MKFSRKTSITAALLLSGGLALTGCSAPTSTPTGPGASSEQPEKVGASLTQENFAERISKAQFAAGSVHMSMDAITSAAGSFEADMMLDKDPSKVRALMNVDSGGMGGEIRLVGGKMYLNMGEMSQNKFVDVSTMGAGMGDLETMLDQINPEAQMAALGAAITKFTAEPKAGKIDGVETTKLTLTLDTRKMFEANPQPGVELDQIVGMLGESITYDMYVGDDDLPRRMVMPNPAGSGDTETNYSAWGTPVVIEAPAADEIVDAASLGG